MTYKEAEQLVADNQYLIGKNLSIDDDRLKISMLIISPGEADILSIRNGMKTDSNLYAVIQSGKSAGPFNVYVAADYNNDVLYTELDKHWSFSK